MKKHKSPDPPAIDLARLLEKRGVHIDFEARLARFEAAKQAAMDSFMEDFLDDLFMEDSLGEMDELVDEMRERLEDLTQQALKDPREQRKRRAAYIRGEHAALAAKLKRSGKPKWSEQAWEELAPKYKKSPYALRRFVERYSRDRHKISR